MPWHGRRAVPWSCRMRPEINLLARRLWGDRNVRMH